MMGVEPSSVRASVNTFKHEYLRSRQADFNQILFYLQVIRTFITSRTSSKFGQIGLRTMELAAIERLEKSK